jgi:hypothetical protein
MRHPEFLQFHGAFRPGAPLRAQDRCLFGEICVYCGSTSEEMKDQIYDDQQT